MKKKRRNKRIKKQLTILAGVLICTLIIVAIFLFAWKPVNKDVKLEVGEQITIDAFLKDANSNAEFKTDVSTIDTTVLGEHKVSIKILFFTFKSNLEIVDTKSPTATPVELSIEAGTIPDAMECVTDIVDMTDVTVSFKETPDTSEDGDYDVIILLTDEGGNVTEVETTIHVWSDKVAPVISGAEDKTITVGGTISYRQGVSVVDDMDENPSLEIDNSNVNLNKVGNYEVVYTATDMAGNSSSVTITVHVIEKQAGPQVDEATVNALAQKVLDSITDDSMSDMEVAFAIYRWTNKNIGYTGSSDKSSWIVGAHQAFTKKSGDCYNYFAAAKALFRVAGIENIDVVKSDTSHSRHYWSLINLGDGWYHVDCTPRKGDGDLFFMVTDAELEAYSSQHSNSHIFDVSAYPARATESVQHRVNYSNWTISQ